MKNLLVVQYEQYFHLAESNDVAEAIRDALELMRGQGGARVVGSYETEETQEWVNKEVTSITVKSPLIIVID